jgi:hypothetical protein
MDTPPEALRICRIHKQFAEFQNAESCLDVQHYALLCGIAESRDARISLSL